jgi:hypothetical protein
VGEVKINLPVLVHQWNYGRRDGQYKGKEPGFEYMRDEWELYIQIKVGPLFLAVQRPPVKSDKFGFVAFWTQGAVGHNNKTVLWIAKDDFGGCGGLKWNLSGPETAELGAFVTKVYFNKQKDCYPIVDWVLENGHPVVQALVRWALDHPVKSNK